MGVVVRQSSCCVEVCVRVRVRVPFRNWAQHFQLFLEIYNSWAETTTARHAPPPTAPNPQRGTDVDYHAGTGEFIHTTCVTHTHGNRHHESVRSTSALARHRRHHEPP